MCCTYALTCAHAQPYQTASLTRRNQAEQKEWKRRLQKAVDKLRDVLCSCLVADFMYGDDGRSVLTPEEYLQMDDRMRLSQWKLNPMPTPPFQVRGDPTAGSSLSLGLIISAPV